MPPGPPRIAQAFGAHILPRPETMSLAMPLDICMYNNYSSFSSFSLVENRNLLDDRRTADAISVTSQSQAFQN